MLFDHSVNHGGHGDYQDRLTKSIDHGEHGEGMSMANS